MHISIHLGIDQRQSGLWSRDIRTLRNPVLAFHQALLEARFGRLCDTYVTIMTNISGKRSGKTLLFLYKFELQEILTCFWFTTFPISQCRCTYLVRKFTMGKVWPFILKTHFEMVFRLYLIRTK